MSEADDDDVDDDAVDDDEVDDDEVDDDDDVDYDLLKKYLASAHGDLMGAHRDVSTEMVSSILMK